MADPDSGARLVREDIFDWPHMSTLLQATLDPELIAEHGTAILRRSLNHGRTVCFVGSGVSMAYGRLSWGSVVEMLEIIVRRQCATLQLDDRPQIDRIRKLLDTLNISGRSANDELQSGRYPAAFQFLEQIAKLCDESKQANRPNGSADDDNNLRGRLAELLFDDKGHVYKLIWRLLEDLNCSHLESKASEFCGLTPIRAKRTREDIDAANFATSQDSRGWEMQFNLDQSVLQAWHDELPVAGPAAEFLKHAKQVLFDSVAQEFPGKQTPLRPLHRFVVPALWRLRDVEKLLAVLTPASGKPAATRLRLRAEITPPAHDPLLILSRDLGINRFITTNYDLDLERLLRDRGFRPDRKRENAHTAPSAGRRGSNGANITTNALGVRAADAVFRLEQAAELIDFTIARSEQSLNVVHLHGRATAGDSMVVTERDYLDQYLQRGGQADVVNDAIGLAFGANTVLFVGSGMGEDDILRPLRQFVAERRSRNDRAAVVLLPATGSRARQIEEVIALYSRYGVHTVHYGVDKSKDGKAELRWLALLLYLVKKLKEILKEVQATPAKSTVPNLVAKLARLTASFDLTTLRGDAAAAPLGALVDATSSGDWPTLKLPEHLEGETGLSNGQARLALEMRLLNVALHFTCDLVLAITGEDLAAAWIEGFARREEHFRSRRRDELPTLDPDTLQPLLQSLRPMLLAHLAVLDGLPDALIGASLCMQLQNLQRDWQKWARERKALPSARWPGGKRWWKRPTIPPERDAGATSQSRWRANEKDLSIPVLARHPVALGRSPISEEEGRDPAYQVPATDRFFAGAPSQTFRTLYNALKEARKDPQDRKNHKFSNLAKRFDGVGRRVFVLLAQRGIGKGHFFEAIQTERRIGEFIRYSWPEGESVRYAAFAYFNLSFSLEIVSAFDRLAALLVDRAHVVFPDASEDSSPAEEIWKAQQTLPNSRIARLAAILKLYHKHRKAAKARVFIAVNSFNILFDERGYPKNAELYRAVMALLGPAVERAPIDLVLVCTEVGFPALFCRPQRSRFRLENRTLDGWREMPRIELEHLVRDDVSEKGTRRLRDVIERLQVNIKQDSTYTVADAANGGNASDPPRQWVGTAFLHVLREARTSNTVAKYFPDVALSVAFHAGLITQPKSKGTAGTTLYCLQDPQPFDAINKVILANSKQYSEAERMIELVPEALSRMCASMQPEIEKNQNHRCKDFWDGFWRQFEGRVKRAFVDAINRKKGETGAMRNDPSALGPAVPLAAQEAMARALTLDRRFSALNKVAARNRFILTMACAAASEWGWRWIDRPRGGRPGIGELCTEHVSHWFVDLDTSLVAVAERDREEKIIGRVLETFQSLHDEERQPAQAVQFHEFLCKRLELDPQCSFGEELWQALHGPPGWELQQLLLWHLAIVGHPVEADVLALAPTVVQRCSELLACISPSERGDVGRQACVLAIVRTALDILVHRCLVFRLLPVSVKSADAALLADAKYDSGETVLDYSVASRRQADADEKKQLQEQSAAAMQPGCAPDPSWRFALHRFMQRAIFSRLHAPYVEHPHVDQFGLSMWATQPDDLPRPSRAAAQKIADVVAEWTGFPRDSDSMHLESGSAFHRVFAVAQASAGAPTSLASAANCKPEKTLPARMLHAAFGVVRSVYSVGVVSRFQDDAASLLAPREGYFQQHRLQVEWLIKQAVKLGNCEALCNDPDAASPFFAEEIVWLYNECGLFGLVEGRLDTAAEMFGLALNATERLEGSGEHGALWCRINLNMAVVDIERGRLRDARRNLNLIKYVGDENPILRILAQGFIALAEHYSGNLEVAEPTYISVINDLDKFGQSRSVAIFARHLADLYRVRSPADADKAVRAIDRSIAAATKGGHEDVRQLSKLSRVRLAIGGMIPQEARDIHRSLDDIERYGIDMGMQRIQADVAYARAAHLLKLGETRHAATLACHCIELATTNNLRLRQMTALALLAKIYESRGLTGAAAPLRARATELADSCDYSNARESVSKR